MAQRYFSVIVFLGCVMFSVLHALTYRMEQTAIIDAHDQESTSIQSDSVDHDSSASAND